MIIAYCLFQHDDGTHMLGPDTFRPPLNEFFDWRFGKDGVPHPATCPTCGRKTDPNFINRRFRAKKRDWDISTTYDGYDIVSVRFRDFCLSAGWPGMEFIPLPGDSNFLVLRLSLVLEFDAKRRATRFKNLCPSCGKFFNVIGVTPPYLKGINEPIREGFFRSDLEFGSGHEQSPLIIIGIDTAEKLRKQKFRKYHLDKIEA